MLNSRKSALVLLFVACCSYVHLSAERKSASIVFEKWIKIQQVFDGVNIKRSAQKVDENNLISLKSRYISVLNFLETMMTFFQLLSTEQMENGFFQLNLPVDTQLKENYVFLYKLLQNDPSDFIQYLRERGFAKNDVNNSPIQINNSVTMEGYKELMMLLFYEQDERETQKKMFSIANDFFEYCFFQKTWSEFEKMLFNEKEHSIVRFLYTTIWWNLAGNGWKNWSAQCLKSLRLKADKKKEIVYIAGGCDIYQLLNAGIYNIRVIDPLLPSQPKYYSEGWDWLIRGEDDAGGIGDEIEFDFDAIAVNSKKEAALVPFISPNVPKGERFIRMKREQFHILDEKFRAKIATGQFIEIEKSETVWGIYDPSRRGSTAAPPAVAKAMAGRQGEREVCGKRIGTLTIERRFVNQDDFKLKKNKELLISFNELYFITVPTAFGGWGINPHRFDNKLQMHVKQLHKPVNSRSMRNMRNAFEQLEFNYIALGTCVN